MVPAKFHPSHSLLFPNAPFFPSLWFLPSFILHILYYSPMPLSFLLHGSCQVSSFTFFTIPQCPFLSFFMVPAKFHPSHSLLFPNAPFFPSSWLLPSFILHILYYSPMPLSFLLHGSCQVSSFTFFTIPQCPILSFFMVPAKFYPSHSLLFPNAPFFPSSRFLPSIFLHFLHTVFPYPWSCPATFPILSILWIQLTHGMLAVTIPRVSPMMQCAVVTITQAHGP